MGGKNTILIIIIVILLGSSAMLFYRTFSSPGGGGLVPEISNDVISIRQEIDAVDMRIKQSMQRIDAGGDLDKLVSSPQFQELVSDSLRPVVVTETGRANPFIPVTRTGGE